MSTREEIKAKYKKLHNSLSEPYYAGTSGLIKEQFDLQHGKIWADMEVELKTASDYVAPPPPPRNFASEIDDLKVEIEILKAR